MSRDRDDDDRDYEPKERPSRRERAALRKKKPRPDRRGNQDDGPRGRPARREPDDDWQEELAWPEEDDEEE